MKKTTPALAKLWTGIGQAFIPIAIGWAFFVRGGFAVDHVPEGVMISRGYWGLLGTLLAGIGLTLVAALYVRESRRNGAAILVPPNMMFEDAARSRTISWGTVIIFALAVAGALVLFGKRYADSRIFGWDATIPLATSFWSSRAAADQVACSRSSCFAIAQRMYPNGPVDGVNQYLPYVTDSVVAILIAALVGAITFLAIVCLRTQPPPPQRRRR